MIFEINVTNDIAVAVVDCVLESLPIVIQVCVDRVWWATCCWGLGIS